MSDQDFTKITGALVPAAQELLDTRGTFYPFAATMDCSGNVALLGADIGSEHPNVTDLLAFLSGALRARAKEGDIRACGICLNVGARLPGYDEKVDAICCQLEHVSARPKQIFVPFRKNQLGRWEYDKPVALPGQPSVFEPSTNP
jgi:hypothetical protein